MRRREVVPTPDGPELPDALRQPLRAARRWALETPRILAVDPAVTRTIAAYADFLPGASSGAARDLTKRLPVIAFRLALVHAMSERAEAVTPEQLERGLALTEYARAGIDWVFGGTVGNRDADLLLRHLQKSGRLTRRQAERVVRDTLRRQDAIDELVRLGHAAVVTVHATRGRPREELQLARSGGPSSRFSPPPGLRPRPDVPNPGTNGTNSTDGLGERWDEGGRKLGRSPAEDPLVDTATGEVTATSEATWASPCRDYRAHQDHHHNTAEGWVCLACQQGGAS